MAKAEDISVDIIENIGIISENSKSGWKKEINLVSWNGNEPKIDIRDWSPDHSKMSKGITLTDDEVSSLTQILIDMNIN